MSKTFRYPDKPDPGPDYRCSKCKSGGLRLWRQSNTMLNHVELMCAECAYKDQVEVIAERAKIRSSVLSDPNSTFIGDLIPARPTPEGDTFWGQTSGDVEWWYALKQYHDRDKEMTLLKRERDHHVVAYQGELARYVAEMTRARNWQERDEEFRKQVVKYREQGYGRMAQIVDEEWRKVDPRDGGLLCLCQKCDTLLDWVNGAPHTERTQEYDKKHPRRTS